MHRNNQSLFPIPYKGLFPDTQNCGLCVRWECRERFPRHRLQRKPPVSDPGMHHGMCVMHVPWCMSGSLTCGGGENIPGIPGACTTRNFAYLVRGPWDDEWQTDSFMGLYMTVANHITCCLTFSWYISYLPTLLMVRKMHCNLLHIPLWGHLPCDIKIYRAAIEEKCRSTYHSGQ